jgi:antitoxin (DNA-binding transcriptional repressor) of toxin-antitoxin stability system
MRSVGLKILKNRLSEYVRLAAGGETVLITDRDRVVAELRPPEGRGPLVSDAYLVQAMRDGLVAPPMAVREGPPPRHPVASLAELLGELDRDRGER